MDIVSFFQIFLSGLGIGLLETMCGVGYTLLLPLILLLLGYDPISVICATTATQAVFGILHWVHQPKDATGSTIPMADVAVILFTAGFALVGSLLLHFLPEYVIRFAIVSAALYAGGLLVAKEKSHTFVSMLSGVTVHSFITGLTGIGNASYGLRLSEASAVERMFRKLALNSQILTCGIVALVCVSYKPVSSVGLFTALVLSAICATALKQFFIVSNTRRYRSCMSLMVIIISLLTFIFTIYTIGG